METYISIIIPNYNGSATIGRCLDAAFSSRYEPFEVIVVDDCSTDNSVEIIKRYPCRLIRLEKHSGASGARNIGAKNSGGLFLFFVDSDCLIQKDTLAAVNAAIEKYNGSTAIIGGTYTALPYGDDFFSVFQSIFVNYFETKKQEPDYVATHAMVIASALFKKSGGFPKDFLPILEDVEFSRRLRKSGYRLVMDPHILVRHIFNFTLTRSLRNAFRKSMFWTLYSLKNGDLLADSGTASLGLKTNGVLYILNIILTVTFFISKEIAFLPLISLTSLLNVAINRQLLLAFYRVKGFLFALAAMIYYIALYPLPVVAGATVGAIRCYFPGKKI